MFPSACHPDLRDDDGGLANCRRTADGTLRMICTFPISRVSLVLSKFLVVTLYTYLLVSFLSV